jgi:hypothetical protein
MKRLQDRRAPIVFHYLDDIIIGDNGFWNAALKNIDLTGKFPPAEQWFHHCLSWKANGTRRVYVDGMEIRSEPATSKTLTLGGIIVLGNQAQDPKNPVYTFGGKLYKLNLYSEQLDSCEIKAMAEAGLCSTIEQKNDKRQLKWEQILEEQRYGQVEEFLPVECCMTIINSLEAKLNQSETDRRQINSKFIETERKLNSSEHMLEKVTLALNDTQLELKVSNFWRYFL